MCLMAWRQPALRRRSGFLTSSVVLLMLTGIKVLFLSGLKRACSGCEDDRVWLLQGGLAWSQRSGTRWGDATQVDALRQQQHTYPSKSCSHRYVPQPHEPCLASGLPSELVYYRTLLVILRFNESVSERPLSPRTARILCWLTSISRYAMQCNTTACPDLGW